MRRPRILACVLAAALAMPATSCSFLFVQSLPEEPPRVRAPAYCSSQVFPILDFGLAAVGLVRLTMAAFVYSAASYQGATLSRPADLAIGAGFLTVGAVSAAYGGGTIAECRRRQARQRRLDERRALAAYRAAQSLDDDEEEDDEAESSDGGASDGAADATPVIRPAPPAVEIRPAPPRP